MRGIGGFLVWMVGLGLCVFNEGSVPSIWKGRLR
jgi:hypothetical protein